MRVILRGRCSIVAPRIVNDASYVTRIKQVRISTGGLVCSTGVVLCSTGVVLALRE